MRSKALEEQVNAFTETVVRSIEQHTAPYQINVNGVPFTLFPTVFNPNYPKAALFFLDNLGVKKGDEVLDPFTGCGVDAIFAIKQGARRAVAIDINKMSYLCAQYNAIQLGLENQIEVRHGDAFNKYINKRPLGREEKFDLVVANPPFRQDCPDTQAEVALKDYKYQTLALFFQEMQYNLKPNGRIRMVFSNIGDVEAMEKIAKDNNFKQKIVARDRIGPQIKMYVYEMTR
ncbi:methyltransferase [Candidatus Woesearchaeota archaeon]|nr:methyltransferase [Candidatus Woesearchaeota archaeon]